MSDAVPEIRNIPVAAITVLNPRSRNKRVFQELVTSIANLGLKKPITVSARADGGFDLIFADAMPGKYEGLEDALRLLQVGGVYVVDDMSPKPNWPEGHQARVDDLVLRLAGDPRFAIVGMDWASGVLVAAKRAA